MLTGFGVRHGAQGLLEGASKAMLENEFGTTKEDEAVRKILEKGSLQEFEVCSSHFPLFRPSPLSFFYCPTSAWWTSLHPLRRRDPVLGDRRGCRRLGMTGARAAARETGCGC
jgi:hypothetical protein